jgi:hypothetical protein
MARGSVEWLPILTIERRPIRAVKRGPVRATALEGLAIPAVRPAGRARPVALEPPARLGAVVGSPVVRSVSIAAGSAAWTDPARTWTS